MIDTKIYSETDGTTGAPEASDRPCCKCQAPAERVTVSEWDSDDGGYTDCKYTCGACGHVWWVDGIDS